VSEGETAFEVHRGAGGAGIFVKFWPVADTLQVTIDDPATSESPDYQTDVVVVETEYDGIGGGFGIGHEVKPGDVVTVTDGTTKKDHIVIDIQVTSIDVAADSVVGTVSTPNSPVTVYAADGNANRSFNANALGNWIADFSVSGDPEEPLLNIVPGTSGGAEQFDIDGDSTVYDWQVPRPEGWQHNPATGHDYLYVDDPMSWAEAEAYAVSLGGHLVTINDAAENDWLVATLGTEYWIGFNDIAAESEWVWVSGEPVTFTNWLAGEPNDYMGEDLAMIWNKPPIGWNDVPDGQNSFVVEGTAPPRQPFFSVSPIEPAEHMWGEEWAPDSEVTIEIDDPVTTEVVDFSMPAGTDGNGRFELYDVPFDIEAGHVVTVSQGATVKTHVVIDLTVTLIDPVADTVSGIGAPKTETVVQVWDEQRQEGPPPMSVMSDDAGGWMADFSGAFDILPRMMTYTYQADADGDQTQIDARPPSFLVFRDWNGLAGWGWPAEVNVQVTADDPETVDESDIDLTIATNADGFFEGAGVFPGLQPGWLITVTYGVTTQTHTVRAISIADADTATDIVRGTADPRTEVWVSVSGAGDGDGVFATADGSGEWVADFSGRCDITIGSEVGISQEGEDRNGTHFGFTVPFPPIPIPPGTSLTTESFDTQTSGTPTVYWQDPLTVSTTDRTGGTGTATLTMSDGYVRTISLVESPACSGTYTGTFDAPYGDGSDPHHGPASISFTIEFPEGPDQQGSFTLYIDPSGVVRDTFGDPVAGATVTLYRSVDPEGPFVVVSDGSAIMSPANRTNPDLTGAGGLFGWDVVAGYYKVGAAKDGCTAPGGSPAFVESAVLTIPPSVIDLALQLDCGGVADTTSPVVTVPADMTVEATSSAGAVVNFASEVSASDPDDAAGTPVCAPPSRSTFALGDTTVTCTSTDTHANTGSASFAIHVVDTTKPTLTLPPDMSVNATTPVGAMVTYSPAPSANDIVDGPITPRCVPPSGSTLPIGDTTVNCSAIDAHGNISSGSFAAHVKGAAQQINDLKTRVDSFTNLKHRTRDELVKKLNEARKELARGHLKPACDRLGDFGKMVQRLKTPKEITVAQRNELIASATRIRAVLGCS
jgi:hypothetical protein